MKPAPTQFLHPVLPPGVAHSAPSGAFGHSVRGHTKDPADCQSFGGGQDEALEGWFSRYLLEGLAIPEHNLRQWIAFGLDQYWTARRTHAPLAALGEIEKAAATFLPDGTDRPTIEDAISTSIRILRFLYGGYAEKLARRCCAAFVIGSMSYGRFYSVRSRRLPRTDLDLLLVIRDGEIDLNDILFEDVVADTLDRRQRLEDLSALAADPSLARFLNYKLENHRDGFQVSLTIGSLGSLRLLLDARCSVPTVLHWEGRLDGLPNIQYDLTRRAIPFPYLEHCAAQENRLAMPAFHLDRSDGLTTHGTFNGIATMLLPRFEALFASPEVTACVEAFIASLCGLADRFEEIGATTELCNMHIRRDSFSPLLAAAMNHAFRARRLTGC